MEEKNYQILRVPYVENGKQDKILVKFNIITEYETEPPRGDAIYSISLKGKSLPFWIYGRNIIFIGDNKAMVESVKCKTWDPIYTIIIDLENEKYANLMEWYTTISFQNERIELSNHIVKKKNLVLKDFEDLDWIAL